MSPLKTRREFLTDAARAGCSAAVAALAAGNGMLIYGRGAFAQERPGLRECEFYEKLEEGNVKCVVCPRECVVAEGRRGYCKNKENRGGAYYSLAHGKACSANASDRIEKKPFFHFLPGTRTFSFAAAGCNLSCTFCQNWEISQARPEDISSEDLPPEKTVELARKADCASVAFTYSEPTVFYEYMIDTAKLAREAGLGAVMVSNGFMNEKPLEELVKHLTAVKVDLKSFSEDFYGKMCGARLKPVLDTLERLKKSGVWFEIVCLMIPTLNDSEKELKEMCAWVKDKLGADVPMHFTRFHPTHKLTDLPQTPVETVEAARTIAKAAGLNFAYVGNVPGHKWENTFCPACDKQIVTRIGFSVKDVRVDDGKCGFCGKPVPGIWSLPKSPEK
jgi:pyruvate formate lyase activating enzyme